MDDRDRFDRRLYHCHDVLGALPQEVRVPEVRSSSRVYVTDRGE